MQEMPITHLCNAFFEKELEEKRPSSLWDLLRMHPLFEQLQFLPLLYRKKGERIAVSQLPSKPYLDFLEERGISTDLIDTLDAPTPHQTLELWGPSQSAARWAKEHQLEVRSLDLDCARTIHSKLYAYSNSCPIPSSHLLQTPEEALQWARSFEGPKVLKKAFGASGSGHFRFENEPAKERLYSLFQNKMPLIGEPWVEKLFEFSTQWKIDGAIEYIGATVLQSSPTGSYLGTVAGDENLLFKEHGRALQEHLDQIEPTLKKIRSSGFFGHLGIDAFVYLWKGKRALRAISEINARKTMGWAALQIQKEHFPNRLLTLRYDSSDQRGFLPQKLHKKIFSRQLFIQETY